ncbi:serine/threonine-protein kinase [Mycobacterium mantenii]|uniref:Protein kinase n=1 Tax=Mycobacterium mantenii TaxID=560555 RepID=A0A1A2SS69_MYCNT|nr:serine/threonine-protein kinase [Mycobacterium mantenii]OBH49510.1 protein kinase [Mycobacterium mantenii]OBH67058.1 protein kinase [Mycobacterium mantenii]OBH74251.1 protein kinase [Mycobacterium mantenii]
MDTRVLLAGRYEVRGRLGSGGMAEVRDGWDTRLRRPIAIKLLHPAVCAQSGMRNRFDAEAHAAAALNHPNIVAIYDRGEQDGRPFIVMERLPGETLAQEMARGPLSQARVQALLDNVLAALSAAHRAAILHRDIKPGNILISAGGESLKVADFGIAKLPEATNTLTGQILGTIAYLSPERIAGAPACVADDLYAVGVVGYEALAGHRPFPQENVAALAGAILHGRPPPLAGLRPDVDPRLIMVIERAMAHDQGQRFASADEMRAAMHGRRDVVAGVQVAPPVHPATKPLTVPVPGSPTNTFVPALVPPTSRRRKLLGVLAVLAVLILIPLALALDASSSHAPVEPATTSTPSPVPVSNAPPPPPPPAQQPPAPPGHGPGKGHGKGNGGGRGD